MSGGVADLLDDVLKASIDGVCVFDREHRCTHWNPSMERLTGTTAEQARGRPREELLPELEQRPFSLSFSPSASGGIVGVARKGEEGINEMLSLASHKLKTPLAALQIHLGAQLRGLQRGQTDREWMEKCTSSAIEQSMRMADTINMLVDVSRIDSGRWKLDITDFELGSVMQHAVQRLKHTAADNGCEVRLETKGDLNGRWDRVRLEEVLATLLANAFKHGAGKPVDVNAAGSQAEVQLVVADRGPEMEADDLAQVFVRGPRTALGLWIAREIVVAHKGTIDVTSNADGTRFVIVMPKAGP